MKNKFKNKENSFFLYFLTKKAFIEIDPIHIAFVAWDEYDTEIIPITSQLAKTNFNFYKIYRIVFKTLTFYFGYRNDLRQSSRKIAKNILTNFIIYRNKNFNFNKEIENLKKIYYLEYYDIIPPEIGIIEVD